jgi:tellurite resistance protein TehA-like permease
VLIGLWRHVLQRVRLIYTPDYWGLVFPLGMYTACTFQLVQATGLTELLVVPRMTLLVALLAWALTFYGLARRLLRRA